MDAILSIKPKYIARIEKGEKRYEFRRQPMAKEVERILIYATAPVSALVGEFKVKQTICAHPSVLWEMTSAAAGISKADFDLYFTGKEKAFAMEITDFKKYPLPVPLKDILPSAIPPQSHIYIARSQSAKITEELFAELEV